MLGAAPMTIPMPVSRLKRRCRRSGWSQTGHLSARVEQGVVVYVLSDLGMRFRTLTWKVRSGVG
jgi:hypothetical protein